MFTFDINKIAKNLNTKSHVVIFATIEFVVFLNFNFFIFASLSIFTTFNFNVKTLIFIRTINDFFDNVNIVNEKNTINDMFDFNEWTNVFDWYLFDSLLKFILKIFFDDLILQYLSWRWIFWLLIVVCTINTVLNVFFSEKKIMLWLFWKLVDKLEKKWER